MLMCVDLFDTVCDSGGTQGGSLEGGSWKPMTTALEVLGRCQSWKASPTHPCWELRIPDR